MRYLFIALEAIPCSWSDSGQFYSYAGNIGYSTCDGATVSMCHGPEEYE